VIDPVTGLPVFTAGPDAPVLTSQQVQEILESDEFSSGPGSDVTPRKQPPK
jgi:hypothetical protein